MDGIAGGTLMMMGRNRKVERFPRIEERGEERPQKEAIPAKKVENKRASLTALLTL